MSYQPDAPTTAHQLDEREAALVEKFRTLREETHDAHAYMIVSLPPQAMQGDEQREAIQSAVTALFTALAAVAS